ncbi:MAG TPA: YtxH domain-containing protein [Verrucomicrobiae bacterium]|nr:YtxH domain-containing protein [Verrucomicrobiae bacterium]
MRTFGRRNTAKQWARLALRCGLLLTDGKLWSSINDELKERADNMSDVVQEKYEDAASRVQEASYALQGRTHWVAPTLSFVGGIGIGVGLGLLFAPVSGEETRAALRNRAADVKNKAGDIAAGASRFGSSSMSSRATGTEGD